MVANLPTWLESYPEGWQFRRRCQPGPRRYGQTIRLEAATKIARIVGPALGGCGRQPKQVGRASM